MNFYLSNFKMPTIWAKPLDGYIVLDDGTKLTDNQVRTVVEYGIANNYETLYDIPDDVARGWLNLPKKTENDMIIEEDYVSEDTALLLKERRFYADCPHINPDYTTMQMAAKWLRVRHDICVYCYNTNSRVKQYGKYEAGASWIKDDVSIIFHNSAHSLFADTYEEAVESIIRYCLTNLID